MKVIIFDFDGTIADSFTTFVRITNRLAEEFGYPAVRPEDVPRYKNLSSRQILRESKVPRVSLPFLLRRFRQELTREIHHLTPIPGMKDALFALKRNGYRLGIVTSNSTENVKEFLLAHHLEGLFDFVGSDWTMFGKAKVLRRIMKRYRLNSDMVVYVGDETRDVEAARKIQIQVVAVSWGFNSSQILAEYRPDRLIHKPTDLVAALAGFSAQSVGAQSTSPQSAPAAG